MEITVRITGSKETQAKLRKLGRDLTDFTSAMRKVGNELADYYADVAFASQGGVFGAKWPTLSPRYAVHKARRYPGKPPLVRTGEMQRSFASSSSRNQAIITNEADWFKYHQSTLPRKKIPRRQMLGVNVRVKSIVKDIIHDDIASKIRSMK